MRRVVITGISPISAIGSDRDTFWQSLVTGTCNFKKIDRFEKKGFKCYIGGEITDFKGEPFLDKKQVKRLSRFSQFAIVSAHKALSDARLKVAEINDELLGIILGTGIGGIDVIEEQAAILNSNSLSHLNPFCANSSEPNAAAAQVSIYLKSKGPHFTIASGCASSLNAISMAYDMIKMGRLDVAITGGSETPLTDVVFSTFDASNQLSTKNDPPEKAVSPFDLNRDGFILSEGAATLILEDYEHALKRNAYIYGEIIGYGQASDAYDSYKMEQEGIGLAASMNKALTDATISPMEIDYICAHGSGSKKADIKETNAIKKVFRERAAELPISTIKDKMGMPFGASGAFQLIASLLMLENQQVIPTINYETPDPQCDLNYVPNKAKETILKTILINSIGIGGNNVSLIVRKLDK